MSISDEIKRLHELHQAGALTDTEFEQAKARLISSQATTGTPDGRADFNNLRRSLSDRWLGGVCGGLARVTGLDSWIWRLIFVLFTVSFGAGILVYILMWIFVPTE